MQQGEEKKSRGIFTGFSKGRCTFPQEKPEEMPPGFFSGREKPLLLVIPGFSICQSSCSAQIHKHWWFCFWNCFLHCFWCCFCRSSVRPECFYWMFYLCLRSWICFQFHNFLPFLLSSWCNLFYTDRLMPCCICQHVNYITYYVKKL